MSAGNGTEWLAPAVRVVDGDTVRIARSRLVDFDGSAYWLLDSEPVAIRLLWVNTPERGEAGWAEARTDLATWVNDHLGPGGVRVVCHYRDHFGRLLGDLIDADGNSASQWLITTCGWPVYVKGK